MTPFEHVGADAIIAMAAAASDVGRGFSAIRFNDGEGVLGGWPDLFTDAELSQILHIWWGRDDFDPATLDGLRAGLMTAAANADVLGTPDPAVAQDKFLRTLRLLDSGGLLAGRTLAHAGFHRGLDDSPAFEAFLRRQRFLGLVTCRDVADDVRRRFGVNDVRVIPVPEEAAFAHAPVRERHFPDRYDRLRDEIAPPFPGAVFLIGAGVCGKVYADVLKRRGGVAIDMGSIFDLWAGRETRPFIRGRAAAPDPAVRALKGLAAKARRLEAAGRTREALDARLEALALAPYQGGAHYEVARLYAALGEAGRAAEHAREAARLRPENPDFAAFRAEIDARPGV